MGNTRDICHLLQLEMHFLLKSDNNDIREQ